MTDKEKMKKNIYFDPIRMLESRHTALSYLTNADIAEALIEQGFDIDNGHLVYKKPLNTERGKSFAIYRNNNKTTHQEYYS